MLDENLSKAFDIDEARKELDLIQTDLDSLGDSDEILRSNINRAQRLLDKIENEWDIGTTNATIRLVEIAAKLIDCITTAANSLIANSVSLEETGQKQEILDLKKLEFELKKSKLENKPENNNIINNNTQNNLYVTTREDILNLALSSVD